MTYPNDPMLADAHVVDATAMLAAKAGWTINRTALIALSPECWAYHYVPDAELLLVPTVGSHRLMFRATETAMRQARSDALVIGIGKAGNGDPQIFASICMWSSQGAHWDGPHLPWLGRDDALWLIPDPRARVDEGPSFRLNNQRLVPAAPPATNAMDRYRGLSAARAFFNQPKEG